MLCKYLVSDVLEVLSAIDSSKCRGRIDTKHLSISVSKTATICNRGELILEISRENAIAVSYHFIPTDEYFFDDSTPVIKLIAAYIKPHPLEFYGIIPNLYAAITYEIIHDVADFVEYEFYIGCGISLSMLYMKTSRIFKLPNYLKANFDMNNQSPEFVVNVINAYFEGSVTDYRLVADV